MSHLQNIVQALEEQIQWIERLPQGVLAQIEEHILDVSSKQLFFDGMRIHRTDRSHFLLLTYPQSKWQLREYPVSVLNRGKFPTTRYILHQPVGIWHGREECIRVIAQYWDEQPGEQELTEVVERFKSFEERLK
jgi:hypothetical protein